MWFRKKNPFPRDSAPPPLQALFEKHAAAVLERQQRLAEATEASSPGFAIDLEKDEIRIGSLHLGPVQILGTRAREAGTWMWAWANPSPLPEAALLDSRKLREWGESHSVEEFKAATFPLSHEQMERLVAASSGLLERDCYYLCPYDGGTAVFVFDTALVHTTEKPVILEMQGVILRLIGSFDIDHRRGIRAYSAYRRVPLAEGPAEWRLGPVSSSYATLTFDSHGRLSGFQSTLV